uniref:Uncharacterized protein n=1 Tax=Arundo donax TaxID=35708 RepID=A0A0A8YM26_ARUDO
MNRRKARKPGSLNAGQTASVICS